MAMAYHIVQLDAAEAESRLSELAELLTDAVTGGASVSFMLPFSQADALAYWQKILPAVADQQTILLAALIDNCAVGTVQLELATPPNQPHRAEVAKLLVHRTARRQGIARALMQTIETVAQHHNRTLLTLDTLTGSVAEQLYRSLGYRLAGVIPQYACLPTGALESTSIFYKQLA